MLRLKNIYPGFILMMGSLTVTPLSYAEVRTFTSPDGRTLEAEIQSATEKTVTLKMANGRLVEAPLSSFSKTDQEFTEAWRIANPAQIRYRFSVKFNHDRVSGQFEKKDPEGAANWVTRITVTNQSGQDLKYVKVFYKVHYQTVNMDERRYRVREEDCKIPDLVHNKDFTILTSPISLQPRQTYLEKIIGGAAKTSKMYFVNKRAKHKDQINGISLTIEHDAETVFEWKSDGVP